MKIKDIDGTLLYAYAAHAGSRRYKCTILKVGVPLQWYQFKGVEIEVHYEKTTEVKRVPARNIVCTWDEHQKEEQRVHDAQAVEWAQRKPYRDAASALSAAFSAAGVDALVRSYHRNVTVTFHDAEQVETIASILQSELPELVTIKE